MLKILSAEQQRELDKYTIEHEPVSSIDLMERAAARCSDFLLNNSAAGNVFQVFCGNGNNGGDGLAIARQLYKAGKICTVYILIEEGSSDYKTNLQRWKNLPGTETILLSSTEQFPVCDQQSIIVDALFGTGLNRVAEGLSASLIKHLNKQAARRVSIDVPSGLFIDKATTDLSNVIHASATLTFHSMKESFLYPEFSSITGNVFIAVISLSAEHERTLKSSKFFIEENDIAALVKPRPAAGHKGTFGHAYLLAGSEGKAGAAILSSRAILRSGAGMVTVHSPSACLLPLQCSNPEVMVEKDQCETHITSFKVLEKYDAIGVGPGIGTDPSTATVLKQLIQESKSALVIDADAINILSENPTWLSFLPKGSILTPHPGEFARLVGNIGDP
ncbi:MAG TPA: NAD(P)H-hydrate epimerase, partial [Bacteroidia bacterium]|nr:NAD(P)H-hydrate epimerase [Bacteroidia bacterium]